MAKIKIIKKDYHKALDIVTNFTDPTILNNKEIERLKKLCEGIVCLIKK